MPVTLPGSSLTFGVVAALASSWLSLGGALLGGCTPSRKADPRPSASASSAVAPAASASAATAAEGSDEIRPVYPVDAGAADPLATLFCEAVVASPERRRAECCESSSAVVSLLEGQCVRTLTFALGHHTVTLAPADVDRCVEALTRATAGCSWVTPGAAVLPAACDGIVEGALAEGASCRSSLECPRGMRCLGLSTVDLGTCGPPKAARSQCDLAVDTLATFTRQEHLDRTHPECAGYCGHHRCEEAVAPGGACTADRACGAGRCVSGKCISAPLPAVGEACTDACAAGSRCVKGTCAAPRADGEGCEVDAECRGVCVRADGGAAGTCVQSCPTYTLPPSAAPAASIRPAGRPGVLPLRRR